MILTILSIFIKYIFINKNFLRNCQTEVKEILHLQLQETFYEKVKNELQKKFRSFNKLLMSFNNFFIL